MAEIEWLIKKTSNDHKDQPDSTQPGRLKGWVTISDDGKTQASSDRKSGHLADVLIHFKEVAQRIGETFGQDKVEEIHIVCEDLTAVCLCGEKETFAAIFDKEIRPNEFLAKYQPK